LKDFPLAVDQSGLAAAAVEEGGQLPAVGTAEVVGTAIPADIGFLEAGKEPVQLPVKMVPAAPAQGQAHAEVQHPVHPGFDAEVQDAVYVFRGVVEQGKDGAEPDYGGDACVPKGLQGRKSSLGGADVGFQLAAQGLVVGGQGHLDHAFTLPLDGLEQVQVPQDQVRFGQQGDAEAIAPDQRQGAAGLLQLGFQREVGVRHGPHAQHTGPAPPARGCSRQGLGPG